MSVNIESGKYNKIIIIVYIIIEFTLYIIYNRIYIKKILKILKK